MKKQGLGLKRGIGLGLGLAALIIPMVVDIPGLSYPGQLALGIFLLAAIFWIGEVVPIWGTSLLVILLQVFLLSQDSLFLHEGNLEGTKLLKYTDYTNNFANPIILLFLAGFFLAEAAVKYGLDKNITRVVVGIFGQKSSMVVLGMLLSTAAVSAFMSNTAATAMMITVVLPILAQLDKNDPLRVAVVLAIPCGANIGGIATPIGTPPNAVVLGAIAKQGLQVGFGEWVLMLMPLVAILLAVTWIALLRLYPPMSQRMELKFTGGWNRTPQAIMTYLIFGGTVLLWMTDSLHGISTNIVSLIPIGLMPLFGIITRRDLETFSWDVLWLMAGGLSLGVSLQGEPTQWMLGLIDWTLLPAPVVLCLLALVAYGLANLISHTVASTILVPLAISLAATGLAGGNLDIATTAICIGVATSFSMLLPISTPPNAIAMSTGMISTPHLVKIGSIVGVTGYVLLLLSAFFFWPLFLRS